jgi:hypothetical protein
MKFRSQRTLFIAHSYGDVAALERLKQCKLPMRASPRIFPPIVVSPDQRVSDDLMGAIRSDDGLVYLRTERSLNSFWVAFERNYALKLKKPVYAFDPERSKFERDRAAAIDPIVAVNWNLAIEHDSLAVRDIAEHLFRKHTFEIRGDKWQRLDNDFRQMLDHPEGLRSKIEKGGVILLFLSNESVDGGFHDYVDPFTRDRANKDCETPIGYTNARFAELPSDRTLFIWLDSPDIPRLEAKIAAYGRQTWGAYVDVIRAALSQGKKCVVRENGEMNWNRVDDIMVRTFHLAYSTSPVFREEVQPDNSRFRRLLISER